MSQPQPDIDRLVREVLAQLGLAPGATTNLRSVPGLSASAGSIDRPSHQHASARADKLPVAPNLSAATDVPVATGGADAELTVSCRVVTMAEVAGRLATIRRLLVPAQAVVTPAVRDELRRRNISLSYAATAPSAAGNRATVRLCLVTVGRRFDAAALAAALAGQAVQLQSSAAECLLAATDGLAAEVVQPGTLGLLLTGHTAAALCLANRRGGVRAVLGVEAAAVAAAVAAVGANLLVADPAAGSSYQFKQIVAEFCRGGIRQCPEVFRERLG